MTEKAWPLFYHDSELLKILEKQWPKAKSFSTLTCCSAVRGVGTGNSSDWGTDQASIVAAAGQSHQATVLFDQSWGSFFKLFELSQNTAQGWILNFLPSNKKLVDSKLKNPFFS